jgi:hypothetical protein
MNDKKNPDAGISSTSGRPSEPIVSISHHYNGYYLLGNLHYFCLIITEKRIICVRTDDLLAARRKDALAGKIPVRAGPLDYLLMPLSLYGSDADISNYFRQMHPSDIIAAHPDAISMPVNGVVSFLVWKGKQFWYAGSASPKAYYWVTQITGRNKTLKLFTKIYPRNILENYPLIRLFKGRFSPPTKDVFGWSFFGKKIDQ